MEKKDVYNKEFKKLNSLFASIDEKQQKLSEGLIQEASELKADLWELNVLKNKTGYIRVSPKNPSLQKNTEVGKMLLKVQNNYVNVIKALNTILNKNEIDPEDEFDEFLKQAKGVEYR